MSRPTNFRILEVVHPVSKRDQLRNRNAHVREAIWEIREAARILAEAKERLVLARKEPLAPTTCVVEEVLPGDPRYENARPPGLTYFLNRPSRTLGKALRDHLRSTSPWASLIKTTP